MTQYITLPKKAIDITGERFSRLVVLGPVGQNRDKTIKWLCQCDCGNTPIIGTRALRAKTTFSCGCYHREWMSQQHTTHGYGQHPLYQTWHTIIRRCTWPNYKGYPSYGGRGITICDEWRDDVTAFCDHVSRLPHYGKKGYTLDRIDNSLGYFPGNLRFATASEQSRNRRTSTLITYNGKTTNLVEWAAITGISRATIGARLKRGWSVEKALTTPIMAP